MPKNVGYWPERDGQEISPIRGFWYGLDRISGLVCTELSGTDSIGIGGSFQWTKQETGSLDIAVDSPLYEQRIGHPAEPAQPGIKSYKRNAHGGKCPQV